MEEATLNLSSALAATHFRTVLALMLATGPVVGCSNRQEESSSKSAEFAIRTDPVANTISITSDDTILWNGQKVSVTQLANLLQVTRQLKPEPELRFIPDADASYDLSSKVIGIIRESHVTKFGFVGNELYSESDGPIE